MDQEEISEIIQKSEELAESVSEKYQQSAFKELLKHYLHQVPNANQNRHNNKKKHSSPISSNSSDRIHEVPNKIHEIPEAFLVAEEGILKHQVGWAVVTLNNEGKEATVSAVQEKIDVDLSVSKPRRESTSRSLGRLVPKYLERRKAEESQGYAYFPTSNISEIFNDIEVE